MVNPLPHILILSLIIEAIVATRRFSDFGIPQLRTTNNTLTGAELISVTLSTYFISNQSASVLENSSSHLIAYKVRLHNIDHVEDISKAPLQGNTNPLRTKGKTKYTTQYEIYPLNQGIISMVTNATVKCSDTGNTEQARIKTRHRITRNAEPWDDETYASSGSSNTSSKLEVIILATLGSVAGVALIAAIVGCVIKRVCFDKGEDEEGENDGAGVANNTAELPSAEIKNAWQ